MGLFDLFRSAPQPRRRPSGRWAMPSSPAATFSTRNFDAAETTNLVNSWTRAPTTIDAALRKGLKVLRARSRSLVRNDPMGRKFRGMVVSNMIGPRGIGMSSLVKGTDGKADPLARDAIEAGWRQWGKDCDASGHLRWEDMQRLIAGSVAMDGEVFAYRVRGGSRARYQLIDPERVDVAYSEEFKDGSYVTMGIHKSSTGRVLGYYVDQPSLRNEYVANTKRIYLDAKDVIHVFVPEEIGQTRGIPWLAAAMLRMNMLDGYMEAALVAARVGAAKALVITSEDGSYEGDAEDSDGTPLIDLAEPGAAWQLRPGEGIDSFDPSYPNGDMPEFVKSCLRSIASAAGVSYNTMANDLEGVSYSSIRQAVLEDQEAWKALQEWFIRAFMEPVFEDWLNRALLNEDLTINGSKPLTRGLDWYNRVAWQPRRWAWIDPLKDTSANKMQVDEAIRSRSDVIREQGRDPEDVWAEIARENQILEELGISVGGADEIVEEMDDER